MHPDLNMDKFVTLLFFNTRVAHCFSLFWLSYKSVNMFALIHFTVFF